MDTAMYQTWCGVLFLLVKATYWKWQPLSKWWRSSHKLMMSDPKAHVLCHHCVVRCTSIGHLLWGQSRDCSVPTCSQLQTVLPFILPRTSQSKVLSHVSILGINSSINIFSASLFFFFKCLFLFDVVENAQHQCPKYLPKKTPPLLTDV